MSKNEMTFSPLSHETASVFIERWHYSHRMPTGKNILFGWFDGETLYAVACYGIGVNAYQAPYLSRVSGCAVTNENLVELKRLARTDPRDDGAPLTRFLSLCHKALRQMGYGYVVSFSDPAQGHSGGIYKAAGFRHLGMTAVEWHVIGEDGEPRHRRLAYRYARRHNISIADARNQLGLTRIPTVPKDRWFLPLRPTPKKGTRHESAIQQHAA